MSLLSPTILPLSLACPPGGCTLEPIPAAAAAAYPEPLAAPHACVEEDRKTDGLSLGRRGLSFGTQRGCQSGTDLALRLAQTLHSLSSSKLAPRLCCWEVDSAP